MANSSIHLTILRRGDVHIADLAEVQAIIPRSETRVDGAFLEEISQEIKRITNQIGPEFRKAAEKLQPEVVRNPYVVKELKNLGSLIFSHLLPQAAREKLRSAESCNLYLRLDDQLVHIPWELAFDGQQFLGMKFRLGRQVITHHKVTQAAPMRAASGGLRMLLISDPSETLKSVTRESEQLCEILDRIPGLEVRLLGGRGVKRIPLLAALRETDIVHFAGHSQFDEKNPENSGWRLHDGFLSASEISKLDQAPLLVFSNSCQAGATKNWHSGYLFEGEAFGLGSAFLLAGVANYIGTFCVVHDEESRFLAVEFYRHLAQGKSIGEALLHARLATAEEMGLDRLTWASYMLYGDPGVSLLRNSISDLSSVPTEERIGATTFHPELSDEAVDGAAVEDSHRGPSRFDLGWFFAALLAAVLIGFLLVMWWPPEKESTELTNPLGSSIEDKPSDADPGPQIAMGKKQGEQTGQATLPSISKPPVSGSQPEAKFSTKTVPETLSSSHSSGETPAQMPPVETPVTGRKSILEKPPERARRSVEDNESDAIYRRSLPPGYIDVEVYKIASAAFRSELANKRVRVFADTFVMANYISLTPELASTVVPFVIYNFRKSMTYAYALIPKAMVEGVLEQRKGASVILYGELVESDNRLFLVVQRVE